MHPDRSLDLLVAFCAGAALGMVLVMWSDRPLTHPVTAPIPTRATDSDRKE